MSEGFRFSGTGKLSRIEKFTTQKGKQIITLIFEESGQYPAFIPIKVFGSLADMASEWKPGDILEVTGKLGGRDWNGKVYGDTVAQMVEVVAGGAGKSRGGTTSGEQQSMPDSPPPGDDDVPF